MKKFLQFSGLIALGLALVAFILLMACPSVVYLDNVNNWYSGLAAIFAGGKVQGTLGGATITTDFDGKLAATALIAWIFVLLAMLALIAVSVLPLLKVKALDNISKMLTLACAGVLLIAGVLLFFTKLAFSGANNNYFDSYSTSFAFVFAGILAILSAACAACPAVLALLGKDK